MEFTVNREITFMEGSSKIASVMEGYSGKEEAVIYGKLRALFGEPTYETKNLEEQYSYFLTAKDEAGEVHIEVYSGASGPSVGGMDDEKSKAAAEALIKMLETAVPSDYEYEGYYLDGPSKVCCGVRNGEPFWLEEELEYNGEEFQKACRLIYPKR